MKKFAFLIIGVSLLSAACNSQTVVNTPNPTPTPTPNQSSNSATANWKTYTNIQYGFEFKYPPRFKIKDLTNVSRGALQNLEFYNDQTRSLQGELPLLFNLYIVAFGKNKSITDAIKAENPEYNSLITQKIIGQETYFRSQINYADGTSLVSYNLGLGSNKYLGFGSFDAKSDLTPELLLILSTFKFTK